ncbi:hypothetical protein OF83DRAFT_1191943, partial [Amylostereum chailletii]
YDNSSIQKTWSDFKRLIGIIGHPNFHPEDVRDAAWSAIRSQLGNLGGEGNEGEWVDMDDAPVGDGWTEAPIFVSIPVKNPTDAHKSVEYCAGNFYYRNLTTTIREKLTDTSAHEQFHYQPYELHWQPHADPPLQHLHGKLYTSEAFLKAYQELQSSPREPGCDLPRHIAATMHGSYQTHLTVFGDAQLWPGYLLYGNKSKYCRSRLSNHLCKTVAYFICLPPDFKDFAIDEGGWTNPDNSAFLAHVCCKLFHAQLRILLDDKFVEAYTHGIIIECPDGIMCRFYPRIFTYAADYPESYRLFSPMGSPAGSCSRQFRTKDNVLARGASSVWRTHTCSEWKVIWPSGCITSASISGDQQRKTIAAARKLIYQKGYGVSSAAVERLLQDKSLVPTENVFSSRLGHLGFNINSILTPDILHDFELGVWKSLFVHLLRLVEYHGPNRLHELDRRYRAIPIFGSNTIRKFSKNVSDLKQLAARDYEDLLQCAIPVFEGLLPNTANNHCLLQLLFIAAHWHGLAKLRLHTDETVKILQAIKKALSRALRDFKKNVCDKYATTELTREYESRLRCEAKKVEKEAKATA